jgi:uncharacterized protein (TIGR02246 family)
MTAARRPEEVDELFTKAMNAGDLEAALALWADDGSFVDEQGEVISGKEALRSTLAGFFALQPQLDLRVKKVIGAGDIAVTMGTWSMRATGPDGPVEMSGSGIAVMRRCPDGSWLYAVDAPWADRFAGG